VRMVEYLFCFVKGFANPFTSSPFSKKMGIMDEVRVGLMPQAGGRRRRVLARMENLPNVKEAQRVREGEQGLHAVPLRTCIALSVKHTEHCK
jgi:hypothetical protein